MPKATSLQEFYDVTAQGPALQWQVPAADLGLAATVPAGGSVTSSLIQSEGYVRVAVGVTSDKTGAVNVQRYLDTGGTIAQGAVVTAALVAGTPLVVNVTADGLPFQSFTVQVTDTAGTNATLTNVIVLLQAA